MDVQEYRAAIVESRPDGHLVNVREDPFLNCSIVRLKRLQDGAVAEQAITDATIVQADVPIGWLVQHVMSMLIRALEAIPPPPYLWND